MEDRPIPDDVYDVGDDDMDDAEYDVRENACDGDECGYEDPRVRSAMGR